MRTNIVINNGLMRTALQLSGLASMRQAVEEGLKLLIVLNGQKRVKKFKGKLKWSGSLAAMRRD